MNSQGVQFNLKDALSLQAVLNLRRSFSNCSQLPQTSQKRLTIRFLSYNGHTMTPMFMRLHLGHLATGSPLQLFVASHGLLTTIFNVLHQFPAKKKTPRGIKLICLTTSVHLRTSVSLIAKKPKDSPFIKNSLVIPQFMTTMIYNCHSSCKSRTTCIVQWYNNVQYWPHAGYSKPAFLNGASSLSRKHRWGCKSKNYKINPFQEHRIKLKKFFDKLNTTHSNPSPLHLRATFLGNRSWKGGIFLKTPQTSRNDTVRHRWLLIPKQSFESATYSTAESPNPYKKEGQKHELSASF